MEIILIFLIFLAIYFLPFSIANFRHHRDTLAIFLCNLFLGWTFLGWVGCLIWAVINFEERKTITETRPRKNSSIAEEIEKLHKLKLTGVLSAEEYEVQKNNLLKN